MEIKRSTPISSFPEWKEGTVVELFDEDGSCGVFLMAWANFPVLINLKTGMWWNNNRTSTYGRATRAVVLKGKFVEDDHSPE